LEKKPEPVKASSVDMELLSRTMEAFNSATEKLQSSYELLQEEARKLRQEVEDKNRRLEQMSGLLQSVLNNTRSAIIVLDGAGQQIIRNRAGDLMAEELGAELGTILSYPAEADVFDYEGENGRFFRLSVGLLASENLSGTVYVIDDITHLKKLEFERQRGEKLQLMGEMAANIAHEIRNPLGSMELFVSLLERDLDNNPDATRLTGKIVTAIRVINRTISNILLFTKEVQISKQKHVLSDIVDDVVLYLQHILKEKQISIINKLTEDDVACVDGELFRQAVMNIVHNAMDAAGQKGEITIEADSSEGNTRLIIGDNGKGIAESMLTRLFIPFQTTKAKGTGLGLSIAYKIVKAHGGDISAESDGKSYSKFIISLPE
jgi:two-component system sensor histidine kinase FlrB